MGIRRGADDTMHILVDGEDMGPAATSIAKVDPRPSMDLEEDQGPLLISNFWSVCPQSVWAVLDLYGPVRSVSIVSSTRLDEPEGTQPPSPSSDTGSEGEEDDEGEEHGLEVRGGSRNHWAQGWTVGGPSATRSFSDSLI